MSDNYDGTEDYQNAGEREAAKKRAAWLKVAKLLDKAEGELSEVAEGAQLQVKLFQLQGHAHIQARLWEVPAKV